MENGMDSVLLAVLVEMVQKSDAIKAATTINEENDAIAELYEAADDARAAITKATGGTP